MRPLRFIRQDGPRVFLDTRDLIGVIEKKQPVSVSELGKLFTSRSARVVLVYTNVAELVPQTDSQKADRGRVRELMRELERLPLSFIRSQEISRHEFRAAIDAFEGPGPLRAVNPYVNQWWQIFWGIPPEYMHIVRPRQDAALRALSMSKMINYLVANNPEALRFDSTDRDKLAASVEDDRKRLGTSRGSPKSFLAGVKEIFIRYQWPEPEGGIEAFSEYLRRDSRICRGWRISHDVYEEYRCNLTGPVTKNDIPDFSHVVVLPYVTHATLDRAWRTRLQQAKHRATKAGLYAAPYNRVYANLEEVLVSFETANSA